MRFHPDALANLVAVIVAHTDVQELIEAGKVGRDPFSRRRSYQLLVDHRREQVLTGARAYYALHPRDYDGSNEGWRDKAPVNGLQNLAKLDRKNLTH